MKIKVVLNRKTLDLLWAHSDPNSFNDPDIRIGDDVVIELDADYVAQAIDLFDEETLDAAIQRLALTEGASA